MNMYFQSHNFTQSRIRLFLISTPIRHAVNNIHNDCYNAISAVKMLRCNSIFIIGLHIILNILKYNRAKIINLDLMLPINGKSSRLIKPDLTSEIYKNEIKSNVLVESNTKADVNEKVHTDLNSTLDYEKLKAEAETKNDHNSSNITTAHIPIKDPTSQDNPENETNKSVTVHFSILDEEITKKYDSSQLDIQVKGFKKKLNLADKIKVNLNKYVSSINKTLSDVYTRRKGDIVKPKLVTNTNEVVRKNVPISEDLVDIRLHYSQRNSFDIGNKDSLALYDLALHKFPLLK